MFRRWSAAQATKSTANHAKLIFVAVGLVCDVLEVPRFCLFSVPAAGAVWLAGWLEAWKEALQLLTLVS